MTGFLRLFSQFRDLQTLSQDQGEALEAEVRAHEETKTQLRERAQSLETERVRRIAAETIASERREEIDRLMQQCRELREDLARVNADRLRSLDALNVKLMREPVPEQPPDMEKWKASSHVAQIANVVAAARRNEHMADMALLNKLHPAFRKVLPMDESVPTEEPIADIG